MEVVVATGAIRSPVRLSRPANQHPTFYRPHAIPVVLLLADASQLSLLIMYNITSLELFMQR